MPSEYQRWYALNLNPEPWAVGPLTVIRRDGKLIPTMGRNQQLDTYKRAIRDELETKYPHSLSALLEPEYVLDFFFWRNTQGGNYADGTNLMKATEDALQGILIYNDSQVAQARWSVVAQGPDVSPAVAFRIEWRFQVRALMPSMVPLPENILDELKSFSENTSPSDNTWPPKQ